MLCKYCNEEIVVNPVRSSPAPFVYHPYKHKFGNFIMCFDSNSDPLRTKAEPKEGR